jgi:hypothetical protein
MEQTAVEWFAKELYEKFEMKGDGKVFDELLSQAKEMEKQQIIDAYYQIGKDHQDMIFPIEKNAEQYYKETFKSE